MIYFHIIISINFTFPELNTIIVCDHLGLFSVRTRNIAAQIVDGVLVNRRQFAANKSTKASKLECGRLVYCVCIDD